MKGASQREYYLTHEVPAKEYRQQKIKKTKNI